MQPLQRTQPNDLLRRQRQQRGWSLQRVADEIRRLWERDGRHVGITAHMVGTWERGNKRPSPLYREKLCQLYGICAESLGLLDTPEQQPDQHVPEQELWLDRRLVDDLLPEAGTEDDDEVYRSEMRRRAFLQRMAGATSAALAASPITLLGSEPWERLTLALDRPQVIDLTTVDDIEAITAGFSKLSQQVRSGSLVTPVLDHLRGITDVLRAQQPSKVRTRLCAAAAQTALLAGWLFHGIGDRTSTRTYWGVALDAARESGDRPLGSYIIGSMSFLPSSASKPREALEIMQQSMRIGERSAPPKLAAWLHAREAELQATIGDTDATLASLERSQRATEKIGDPSSATPQWLFFNEGWMNGFAGISLVRIHQPGKALPHLRLADDKLTPLRPKHRAVLLTDMAAAQIQLGELDEACNLAARAMNVAREFKDMPALKRVAGLRGGFEPWKDSPVVQGFEEQLHQASLQLAGV
jgi:transcriptional regulator with XRE-family HTH domain